MIHSKLDLEYFNLDKRVKMALISSFRKLNIICLCFWQKNNAPNPPRKGSAPFTSADHVNLSSSRDSHPKHADKNGRKSAGALELDTRKNFKELIWEIQQCMEVWSKDKNNSFTRKDSEHLQNSLNALPETLPLFWLKQFFTKVSVLVTTGFGVNLMERMLEVFCCKEEYTDSCCKLHC